MITDLKMKWRFVLAMLLWVAPVKAAEKPNVLLLLVDDLKPAMGCYGDRHAITPAMDALAARGMRFDLAYCNQAVCAPSRFTLMLGSHSTSTGLYGLGSQLRQVLPNAVTMPQHFAKHGYRTESLGKVFHIGHGNLGDPKSFSIPHFHDKVIEYLDPKSTDGGKLTREEALFTNQKLGAIRSLPRGAAFEAPVAEDDDYADGRVAAETIRRLEAAKARRAKDGTPFFITAGFVRPHLPFSAPKKYWDLFDPTKLPMPKIKSFPKDAPAVALKRAGEISAYTPVPVDGQVGEALTRELIHGYYASTAYVDAQIGRVTTALKRLALEDNTIVVLWGDHGWHLGDLSIWTKHTNYEQANRIPILVVAPGVAKPGSATRQLTETVDLFPTLAELAGLPAPKGPQAIDGKSLVPVLKNPKARVRDHAFHCYPRRRLGRAIRTERYRLVEWRNAGERVTAAEYELYDYAKGEVETVNIAAKNPALVKALAAKLAAYPEPVVRGGRRLGKVVLPSPKIAGKPLRIEAEIQLGARVKPQGVVLAQGGKEHGYAIHWRNGQVVFDVRVNGKVSGLQINAPTRGTVKVVANLYRATMSLEVGDMRAQMKSPGLLPVQPKDALSIGFDDQTAAGNYNSPNTFNGKVLSHRVQTLK